MPDIGLPRIEDIDVGDLASLSRPYRYEMRGGNLVISPPSTYWHKLVARRLMIMLYEAGLEVLPDTGVRGGRPRDMRLPDLGVVKDLPPDVADYSTLPGFAFGLVVEIVEAESVNGEYGDKLHWYAECGIAEYWIVDHSGDDALVHLHRLKLAGGVPAYERERSVLLKRLEAEFRAKAEA